jgi:hypothetical protein
MTLIHSVRTHEKKNWTKKTTHIIRRICVVFST